MLNLKFVVENVEAVKENLSKRSADVHIIDTVVELDEKRKKLTHKVETSRAEVKSLSKQIGPLKQKGEDASDLMAKVAQAKSSIDEDTKTLDEILGEQNFLLSSLPNLIADDVPVGKDEADNKLITTFGDPKKFDFEPKDHVALGEDLGMLDFEKASEITGARFVVYKKDIAKLERACINFFLNELTSKKEYEEIIPPFIVHERSLYGTGQLPKFKEDLFKIEGNDWYLIPTAEVPLTNLKRDELFQGSELPLKYCGYTPCFRSEAGSHGKDTRGLIRLHQFNKVEMVNIVAADKSEEAHEAMLSCAKDLLEQLGLAYRVMLLCSGDIGFGARRCYDIEVWLPAQNKYREISSISNCWDFQARRANIRYRNAENKPEFAHTLNGSGLAVGRTVVAIMENYQQADGSIKVPDVLIPYMGGQEYIKA